jgi:hypothetical protein
MGLISPKHSSRKSRRKATGEIERIITRARKEGIRVIRQTQGGRNGGGIAQTLRELGVNGR